MELVIGNGMIGKALGLYLEKEGEEVKVTERGEVDLRKGIWELPRCRRAYICAGETSTQRCEEEPEETRLVNVTNTIKLGEGLRKGGAEVVWLSSERVYDGSRGFWKVSDEVCPRSEYGKQKAEAEKGLLGIGCIVLRLSKVLGERLALFEGWAKDLRNGMPISPLCNYSMSPLPVSFVVKLMARLSCGAGLYQVSGLEDYGYGEIANHIAKLLGVQSDLVNYIHAPYGHSRTTLDDNGIVQKLGMKIPSVWETIDGCVRRSCSAG